MICLLLGSKPKTVQFDYNRSVQKRTIQSKVRLSSTSQAHSKSVELGSVNLT